MAVTFPPSGTDAKQRKRAAFGFVAGFVFLLLLSSAAWVLSFSAIPSFEWVSETQAGITKAEGLMRLLAEADAAGHAFVITRDERFRNEHREAVRLLRGVVDDIAAQVAGKPEQVALVTSVRQLVDTAVAEMDRAMEAAASSGFDAARGVVMANADAAAMQRIREAMSELISTEVVQRSRQEATFIRRSRRATRVIGLALVVTIGLMAFAVRWLHRRMRDLENIVTVCAWTKRVKHRGQWISIEDYLRQRYGLQFSHGISEEAKKQLELEGLEHRGRG